MLKAGYDIPVYTGENRPRKEEKRRNARTEIGSGFRHSAEDTELILQAFKKYLSCDPVPLIIFVVCLMLNSEKLNVERRTHLTDGTKSAAGFHLIG